MMFFFYIVLFVVFAPAVLVATGLPFRNVIGVSTRFTQHTFPVEYHQKVDLPNWLKWLQNPNDGLFGDKRGWFWNTYKPKIMPVWIWQFDTVKMWWWSAWRNPWNYLKRRVIGVDVRHYAVFKLIGQDVVNDNFEHAGFHILYAIKEGAKFRPFLIYWIFRYGKSSRALRIRIGWKIKLKHTDIVYEDEKKYHIGATFRISPYHDIS
jgi:hypothetical protein